MDDVSFAKHVLNLLIKDRYAARTLIDWPNAIFLGYNVGEEYNALKSKDARTKFALDFIDGFSLGFLAMKHDKDIFFNWELLKQSTPELKFVVANVVDKNHFIELVITQKGRVRKLAQIHAIANKQLLAIPKVELRDKNVQEQKQEK